MNNANQNNGKPSDLQAGKQRCLDGTFAPGNSLGRQFKKGQSGNPSGCPKGSVNVWPVIMRYLDCEYVELKELIDDEDRFGKLTMREQAALRIVMDFAEGKDTLQTQFLNRELGKIPDNINHDLSLTVNINRVKSDRYE